MSKNRSKIHHFGLWPGGRASPPGLAGATPESPYAPWCTRTCSRPLLPCENLVFQHIFGENLVGFLARFLARFWPGSTGPPWGAPGSLGPWALGSLGLWV